MKRWIVAAAATAVLLGTVATANADDHHWHGGFHRHWHHEHWRHDRDYWPGRFYLGIGPVWNPLWYPPGYPYYYSPAPVIVQPPTTYIERPTPKQEHYWYYCEHPKGYYPYVKQCPQGWMKVVPQSPSQ